ncbi:MAG: hypothetical protein QW165_00785 [Candidatus Woesearchaeota archaeon]
MTKVLTDSVEETYKQVFGRTNSPDDRNRITFLREVVTGMISYKQQQIPLEKAIFMVEQERDGLADDYANETDKSIKSEIEAEMNGCSQLLLEYDAIAEMRKWYLESEKTNKQDAKICVVQPLLAADMIYVHEALEDCMEVLYQHRIQSLIGQLDKAMKVKKNKDSTIRMIAESLLEKKIPAVTDAVISKMASYHSHLKRQLDFALEGGNERAIKYAVTRLNKTNVPTLQKYAQEQTAKHYANRDKKPQ